MQLTGGVDDQRHQLHGDPGQPPALRVDGGDGDRQPAVRPEERRGGCWRSPRTPAAAATAPARSMAAPKAAPGHVHSPPARPCACGVWQSSRLSTLQYWYGPTRVRWPCEYALISGRCGPCSRTSAHAPTPAADGQQTTTTASSTATAGFRVGFTRRSTAAAVRLAALAFLLDHHRPITAEAGNQRVTAEADDGLRQTQDQHATDGGEADPQFGVDQHAQRAAEHPGQLQRRLRTPERRCARFLGQVVLQRRVQRRLRDRARPRRDQGGDRRPSAGCRPPRRPARLPVTATVQRTTSTAGRPSRSRALAKLPAKLPIAAAAPIRPSMPSCTQPLA